MKASPEGMREMLEHSGGARRVPIIVRDGTVEFGFGGT